MMMSSLTIKSNYSYGTITGTYFEAATLKVTIIAIMFPSTDEDLSEDSFDSTKIVLKHYRL